MRDNEYDCATSLTPPSTGLNGNSQHLIVLASMIPMDKNKDKNMKNKTTLK
jgi:hypothetical protein